uniref:DC1 domain-containing protein n=1 Tax=Quercus lobata TaxID=97700 RepID=A0A7N2L4P0_QUELO
MPKGMFQRHSLDVTDILHPDGQNLLAFRITFMILDPMLFKVNGQPIFIHGGNWILSDGLLCLSREHYETDIKFHANMNFNMICYWGDGLAERPECENEQVPPDDINRALKSDLGLHPYFENSNEISKSLKLYLQCQKILANILMVHVFTSKDPCGMDLQIHGFNAEVGSVGMAVADTIRATMSQEGWQIPLFKQLPSGVLLEGWTSHKYTSPDLEGTEPWTGLSDQLNDHLLHQLAGFYGCRCAVEPFHVLLNLATYFIEMEQQQQQQLQHFIHPNHPLLFNPDDDRRGRRCWGCWEPVHGPSYSCKECDYWVHHKSCAELPLELHHPLHPIHPLILFSPPIWAAYYGDDKQVYKCELCKDYEDVYTYRCSHCDFNIYITCTSLAPTTMVEAEFHHHPLTPFWKWITFTCEICGKEDKDKAHGQKCNCCDNERNQVFRCITCEFVLDFQCATLPHTTRYGQHEHPFTLSYRAEDNSGEYYCDICEEERQDSKYWFYYCKDCSYPAHPNCIIGKYPNYKFGGAYTFACHSHPLTFVEETKNSPQCNECNGSCKELIYQCAQCKFYIHRGCL